MKQTKQTDPEERYHNEEAETFTAKRQTDYIWEVPELYFILNRKYIKKGDTVIDMGCGPAVSIHRSLEDLGLKQYVTYVGVDISQKMLDKARILFPDSRLIHSDIEKTPIKNGSADIILSLGALHHTIHQTNALLHWYKLLKKDGLIILREPAYEYLIKGTGASPLEEGIKIGEIETFAKDHSMKILLCVNFYTGVFHFINRIFIHFGFPSWIRYRFLSLPIIIMESLASKIIRKHKPIGDSYILVLKK